MASEELLDVLNEAGEHTGKTEKRSVVHKRGLWHRVVHVWFSNSRGQLLMQKRAMQKQPYLVKWDVSVAVHVEAGDDAHATVVKEVGEEIDFPLTLEQAKAAWQFQTRIQDQTYAVDNEIVEVYWFECDDIVLDELVLQAEEVDSVRYLPWRLVHQCISSKHKNWVCDIASCKDYQIFWNSLAIKYP